ncbi:MAG: hypothetical protein ACYCSN_20025 [Acidobacteriaceae bacterium]
MTAPKTHCSWRCYVYFALGLLVGQFLWYELIQPLLWDLRL